jgi:hypothetical protein
MPETKRIVAVVYALGLLTCFLPLFSLSPAALGKTEWSAWDILELIASRPNSLEWLLRIDIVRLGLAYALLAGGLLLLWLPQYLKAVSICTILSLGSFAGVHRHYSYSRMFETLAGWHRETLVTNPEAYVLPALLVLLLFVLSIEIGLANRR